MSVVFRKHQAPIRPLPTRYHIQTDADRSLRLVTTPTKTIPRVGYRFAPPVEAIPMQRPPSPSPPSSGVKARQEIRYCTTSDGVRPAYAGIGSGPPLVKASNWLTHLDFEWGSPIWRHWYAALSRHH